MKIKSPTKKQLVQLWCNLSEVVVVSYLGCMSYVILIDEKHNTLRIILMAILITYVLISVGYQRGRKDERSLYDPQYDTMHRLESDDNS